MMMRYPIQYAPFISEILPPGYSLKTLEGDMKFLEDYYIKKES